MPPIMPERTNSLSRFIVSLLVFAKTYYSEVVFAVNLLEKQHEKCYNRRYD